MRLLKYTCWSVLSLLASPILAAGGKCAVIQIQTLVNNEARGAAGLVMGGKMACLGSWTPHNIKSNTSIELQLDCDGAYDVKVSYGLSEGDHWLLQLSGGGCSISNGKVPLNATAHDESITQKWYAAGFLGCHVKDFPTQNINQAMTIRPAAAAPSNTIQAMGDGRDHRRTFSETQNAAATNPSTGWYMPFTAMALLYNVF